MKAKILVLLFLAIPVLSFADDFAVLVENAEAKDFYYTLDPPELEGFNPVGSVFSGILYDYFAEAGAETDFQLLAASSTERLTALAEGSHLIVGVFVLPGEPVYPVRVLRIQAGGGIEERFYTLYAEPSIFSAKAGLGRLQSFGIPEAEPAVVRGPGAEEPARAEEPVRAAEPVQAEAVVPALPMETAGPEAGGIVIDNSYGDWESVPFLAAFGEGFAPASFTREEYGRDFASLPLSDARHWRKGGTALSEVKALATDEKLYIYFSTRSAIADNLSIFLYLQTAAPAGKENSVTLELIPSSAYEPGVVVLWERDREPRLAGRLFSGSFFLEAEVDLASVGQALDRTRTAAGAEDLRVDLTSCYFDRSGLSYEEFFFSSLSLMDVPRREEIVF